MSYALTSSEHYLGTLNTEVEVFSSELSFDCRTWLEEKHYEELAEQEGLRKKSRKGNFYVVLHPSYFEELVAKGDARYRDGQVSDFNKSLWTLLVLVLMTALSACGGTRAAHVEHLTPETQHIFGESYYDSSTFTVIMVEYDYDFVDYAGFAQATENMEDDLESFFRLYRMDDLFTEKYKSGPHGIISLIQHVEHFHKKDLNKAYKNVRKNPTDAYFFEWWFLVNYRSYFILENNDTGEISYIVFKKDKGYVWLRTDDPEKKYIPWLYEEYPHRFQRRVLDLQPLPRAHKGSSNNPKKQE